MVVIEISVRTRQRRRLTLRRFPFPPRKSMTISLPSDNSSDKDQWDYDPVGII